MFDLPLHSGRPDLTNRDLATEIFLSGPKIPKISLFLILPLFRLCSPKPPNVLLLLQPNVLLLLQPNVLLLLLPNVLLLLQPLPLFLPLVLLPNPQRVGPRHLDPRRKVWLRSTTTTW